MHHQRFENLFYIPDALIVLVLVLVLEIPRKTEDEDEAGREGGVQSIFGTGTG
jgi:hypothetical protein